MDPRGALPHSQSFCFHADAAGYPCLVMKVSAGLLMYRVREGEVEFLLAHPGGPFWKNRDNGAWSIPKGEVNEGEDLLEAAKREFEEELGLQPRGAFLPLEPILQKNGKRVHAFAVRGDCAPDSIRSNTFRIEWPPRSGRYETHPEVGVQFFRLPEARQKVNPAQMPLLEELARKVSDMDPDKTAEKTVE